MEQLLKASVITAAYVESFRHVIYSSAMKIMSSHFLCSSVSSIIQKVLDEFSSNFREGGLCDMDNNCLDFWIISFQIFSRHFIISTL